MKLSFRLPSILARWRSLRTQLITWNIVTLAVMVALLGGFVEYTVRATILGSVDRQLEAMAQRFLHHPPPPGNPPPDQQNRGFRAGPAGISAPDMRIPLGLMPEDGPRPSRPKGEMAKDNLRILDKSGRTTDSLGASPWDAHGFTIAMTGKRVFTTTVVNNARMRVLSMPLREHGSTTSVAQWALPLADVDRALDGMKDALLMLIPVALLWSWWGGTLLTGRALRPVRRLTQTAGRISARDLSERLPVTGNDEFAELSSTFNGMLERLETSFDEQRRFTADASHELRTPLTIIKANTSLTLGGSPSADEYRQAMEDIDRAADTATYLVQDLLVLARSDAGQLGRRPISVPIREILQQSIAGIPSGGPAIHLEVPDAALCVTGREEELTRVFANLVQNAVRYTPRDGSILLKARKEGSNVVVDVVDTGTGIAPQHLPHLGERFYRADPSRTRSAGGYGLGLSICKSIVLAHGGHIAFRSQIGKGTTVTVTLPVGV